MLEYLVLGFTFAFAAAVQPGPLTTYLISQTISKGWRSTLPASLAPLLSDGPIILLVLFLLSHISQFMISILQILGGLFLLYLSFNAYISWKRYSFERSMKKLSPAQTLLKAALVNFLNPNPYLGWSLVMGPLLIKGWHESPSYGLALLLSFYTTIIIVMGGIIIVFAAARNLGPRLNKMLIGISAVALLFFGLYEIYSGGRVYF
ncbi:MAG TPA: LysE family transporter [Ignavibacteriales bacterium]|nr:LysE family transporter [Ignavibacteriales bacterium]